MSVKTAIDLIGIKAPQFSTDPRLSDLVSIAESQTGTIFGENYNLAVALRVCHWLTIESRNGGDSGVSTSGSGNSGFVKSEKEGDLSRSYENAISQNNSLSYLSSSSFGMELYGLIRQTVLSVRNRFV